jgi:hypothetical protein
MNGASDIKVYCINFFARGINLAAFTQYLYDSKDIIAFWNYIPLVYCVKSRLSATELTAKLRPFIPSDNYMVAEVNLQNINGVLPIEAWHWFYLQHHEKSRPPSFPAGPFGAAWDLGLLPKPPER